MSLILAPRTRNKLIHLCVALAVLIAASDYHAQTPCGNGTGLQWCKPQEAGVVNGARFLIAISIPQCIGDLQDVKVIVQNPTSKSLRVSFSIEFTSIGGLHEMGQDAAGPINSGWVGDAELKHWSPFKGKAGVRPDSTLLVSEVALTHVTVCADHETPRNPSAYKRPCEQQPETLLVRPSCPAGEGDSSYGYTPLMLAAREGDSVRVLQWIACGSDVNASASDGYTALMFAANSGVLASAEALLRAGAKVNARQDGGLTALGIVGDVFPEMTTLLRRYGARQ